MTRIWLLTVTAICGSLAACGGNDAREVDCVANLKYQNRVEGTRVVAPEGLDQLNELAEMPIPRADPNAPQLPPGACNDEPPILDAGS
jgi:hypothetical protein